MTYNDIKNVFNDNLNIVLTADIIIDKIYRQYDRKPDNNFVFFKEEMSIVENGCTNSIVIEVSSVFENELLAIRCRDEIIKMINEDSLFSSLIGNHEALYSNGVIEYNKTLFMASFSVRLNLL